MGNKCEEWNVYQYPDNKTENCAQHHNQYILFGDDRQQLRLSRTEGCFPPLIHVFLPTHPPKKAKASKALLPLLQRGAIISLFPLERRVKRGGTSIGWVRVGRKTTENRGKSCQKSSRRFEW
jgi:hypothetical protein